MLTTYQRLMDAGKVTRTGTVTYDNRPQDELVKQLQAEVEALRLRVRELTGEAGVGPKAQTADLKEVVPVVMHSIKRRICCWCQTTIGLLIAPDMQGETHGGCERCVREWRDTYLRREDT